MPRVWICQCLCPARHCIVASAGMAESAEDAEATIGAPLHETVADGMRAGWLNPWCGLCMARSETWTFDLAASHYATMAEAEPDLLASEQAQRAVAAKLGR
jgi:hypothetical protein